MKPWPHDRKVKGGMKRNSLFLRKLLEIALGIAALELLFYLFRLGAAVYVP